LRPKSPKLMKTNVEKMSVFRLSMMLMKTNDLHPSFHDVDENKGERRLTRAQQKVACSHSSLLVSMGATVIRHGQDPDGSGQVGHATRRGPGVPPISANLRVYGIVRSRGSGGIVWPTCAVGHNLSPLMRLPTAPAVLILAIMGRMPTPQRVGRLPAATSFSSWSAREAWLSTFVSRTTHWVVSQFGNVAASLPRQMAA
jgi:hypothetical protein